jgi:methionyl-tRNA formyltransferase
MKLVFMGTPDFAVPSLQALQEAGHQIAGVFTQPDRPAGRGKKMMPSPVKVLAEKLNLPVFQPLKIKTPEAIDSIRKLEPECIVVVAYGQILSPEILNLPPYGCINVHASLLPSYRGAAPIHWAVLNGEQKTGVTTMLMDEGLDTGDMLLAAEYPISSTATTGEVHDALARLGAEVLLKTLRGLQDGTLKPVPQPQEFTYAPPLKREHERIDWSHSALAIHNQIRGLNPWPGAYTTFRGRASQNLAK